MKRLHTTAEVARRFNITSATLNNWINSHKIDCYLADNKGRRLLNEDNINQVKKVILEKYNLAVNEDENNQT